MVTGWKGKDNGVMRSLSAYYPLNGLAFNDHVVKMPAVNFYQLRE